MKVRLPSAAMRGPRCGRCVTRSLMRVGRSEISTRTPTTNRGMKTIMNTNRKA